MSQVAQFALDLPEGWRALPAGDGESWADGEVDAILGSGAPAETRSRLREQILAVASAAGDTQLAGLTTAYRVLHPQTGLVDAMLSASARSRTRIETYRAEIEHLVGGVAVLGAQPFSGEVAAGSVEGTHLLLGHAADGVNEDEAGSPLEERVVAAVVPAGSDGLVEVVVIAATIGSFGNMAQEVLDLLTGIEIEVSA